MSKKINYCTVQSMSKKINYCTYLPFEAIEETTMVGEGNAAGR